LPRCFAEDLIGATLLPKKDLHLTRLLSQDQESGGEQHKTGEL
jgi:hypothetical protein